MTDRMFKDGMFKDEVYAKFSGALLADGKRFEEHSKLDQDRIIFQFLASGGIISEGDGKKL